MKSGHPQETGEKRGTSDRMSGGVWGVGRGLDKMTRFKRAETSTNKNSASNAGYNTALCIHCNSSLAVESSVRARGEGKCLGCATTYVRCG